MWAKAIVLLKDLCEKRISVEAVINAPMEKVWICWNEPQHIKGWAFAMDTWEAPYAENDLREGGKFVTTMAAKDGSTKFDFGGTYTKVVPNQLIEYTMGDALDSRKASIFFDQLPEGVRVTELFDMEDQNSEEMQKGGWQSILNNFKKYTESQK
ncbi:SRPBCC domain-containing protein [Candidatus Peregrinibacteria bacterium]|nr:SRPBCC domain-containing protein [Candidatus Peregrinibacteria bacterium]